MDLKDRIDFEFVGETNELDKSQIKNLYLVLKHLPGIDFYKYLKARKEYQDKSIFFVMKKHFNWKNYEIFSIHTKKDSAEEGIEKCWEYEKNPKAYDFKIKGIKLREIGIIPISNYEKDELYDKIKEVIINEGSHF